MKRICRRFCDQEWRSACNGVVFAGASSVAVNATATAQQYPTPWTPEPAAATSG